MKPSYLVCDRCGKTIALTDPYSTCNVVQTTYKWETRNLCTRCTELLYTFLGAKKNNPPEPMEFWYGNRER